MTRPPRRRRPLALAAAVGGGLLLIVVAALFAGAHLFGPGGTSSATGAAAAQSGATQAGATQAGAAQAAGPGTPAGVFGVATVTSGCPAAAGASGARCPSSPECWNGIVEISGDVTAGSLPCAGSHDWETFAIGILPAAVSTFDAETVGADPAVRAVCSAAVLARSRAGTARQIPAGSWTIEVMPPDEAAFDSGARAYRCLARPLTGPAPATSQFLR